MRNARPALHYTSQFAALLGSESSAADIARIKSPAFAATLANGHEASRHRSVAIGAALACILVAGSAGAVWQFSGDETPRAPEFAGTLMVADPSGAAAPGARAAAFDTEAHASDQPGQALAGGPPAYYLPASSIAGDLLPRRPLQAAIDAAPFRPSILGIATAGLPVGAGAFESASETGLATSDPAPALDAGAAAGPSTPLSNSSADGGQSPLSSAMEGEGLPSDGSSAGDPLSNGGHREAERSNYLTRFAKETFRTTAAVAPVARSLEPATAGTPEADSEFDNAGDPSASVDQGSPDATQPAADGSGSQAGGEPAASAKHRGSSPDGDREVADGSSKADNDPTSGGETADGADGIDTSDAASGSNTSAATDVSNPATSGKHKGASAAGAGSQASSGSGVTGRSADGSSNTDGDPGSGASSSAGSTDSGSDTVSGGAGAVASDTAADASGQSGKGHAKHGKSDGDDSGDSGTSGQSQGGPAAGHQSDPPGQQGKAKDANDGGGPAGPNGGEGDGGSDAGPAGKGSGDPGGGDPGGAGKGGGKEHGGKGNGGKDHGGKGGG